MWRHCASRAYSNARRNFHCLCLCSNSTVSHSFIVNSIINYSFACVFSLRECVCVWLLLLRCWIVILQFARAGNIEQLRHRFAAGIGRLKIHSEYFERSDETMKPTDKSIKQQPHSGNVKLSGYFLFHLFSSSLLHFSRDEYRQMKEGWKRVRFFSLTIHLRRPTESTAHSKLWPDSGWLSCASLATEDGNATNLIRATKLQITIMPSRVKCNYFPFQSI